MFALLCTVVGLCRGLTWNFRRDYYLPTEEYNEEAVMKGYPVEGGRLQLISESTPGLINLTKPLKVNIGSFEITLSSDQYQGDGTVLSDDVDWLRCYYDEFSGTVLLTTHAHTDSFLNSLPSTSLKVTDAAGQVLVSDNFPDDIEKLTMSSSVQVTYATTRNGFKELVVHLHNYNDYSVTIKAVSLLSGVSEASIQPVVIEAGNHEVILFDVSKFGMGPTSVWTITLTLDDGSVASFGGRLIKEHFPIEDWPKSDDVPYPTDDCSEENFETLYNDLHIDTHFFKSDRCGDDTDAAVFDAAVASQETSQPWYLFPSESFWDEEVEKVPPASAAPAIIASALADEIDSSYENAWNMWYRVMKQEENTAAAGSGPYPTYTGGHFNTFNGAFAGGSDIQGMDFYVAGCAPHATIFLQTMRIQGAYDYLYNSRQNMKPLPTWGYSQAFCTDCWSNYALNGNELIVQMASVVSAGAKGLMLFQSDIRSKTDEKRGNEKAWDQAGDFLASVKFMGENLRVSDVEGGKLTTSADPNGEAIVNVLGGPESSIVIYISTGCSGYSDVTCYIPGSGGRHWDWETVVVDKTTVELPQNMINLANNAGKTISEYFELGEVLKGNFKSSPDDVDLSIDDSGSYTLKNLKLGTQQSVVRSFMLRVKQ